MRKMIHGVALACLMAFGAVSANAASNDAKAIDGARAAIAAGVDQAIAKQGGTRVLAKIDAATLRESITTELRDNIYRVVKEGRIAFSGLAMHDGNVEIHIAEAKDRQLALGKLASMMDGPSALAVTDGGDGSVRLAPSDASFAARLHEHVRVSMAMIEELLRGGEVTQVGLRPEGVDGIRITAPGVTDPQRVIDLLTKKHRLGIRLVDTSTSPEAAARDITPPTSEVLYGVKDKVPYLVSKEEAIGSDDVSDVGPGLDPATQQPIIQFRFNGRGARRFAHLTEENLGKPFAIVLDDIVVSAPVIREVVTGGSGQISGNFSLQEVNALAMQMRAATPGGRLIIATQEVVQPGGK